MSQDHAPLRILHVAASMTTESGGPAAVCAGLTGALAQRGHQVAIATVDHPRQTLLSSAPAVALHAFPMDGPPRYARSVALRHWLMQNVSRFDIVHLHAIWQYPTFMAARACWKHRIPYVSTLHGMLDTYSVNQNSVVLKKAYWLLRERRIQRRAAGLHCLNRAEIHKAVPWIAGMPKFVIPNGIDEAQLAAMPARGGFRRAHSELSDKPIVLFLSRVHPKKGLDRLLPVWSHVVRKVPSAQLLIAGTGEPDYVASLQKLATDLGIAGSVHFLGQLAGASKWQALVDADVFVLPSHQEGFSMAITEALAAGAPAVITEECNFDEIAPPAPARPAGVIIRHGDMPGFAAAVADLLVSPDKRQSFSAAGRAMIPGQYTWQKIAGAFEDTYRTILAGQPLPAIS